MARKIYAENAWFVTFCCTLNGGRFATACLYPFPDLVVIGCNLGFSCHNMPPCLSETREEIPPGTLLCNNYLCLPGAPLSHCWRFVLCKKRNHCLVKCWYVFGAAAADPVVITHHFLIHPLSSRVAYIILNSVVACQGSTNDQACR